MTSWSDPPGDRPRRVIVEGVTPQVDAGRFPIKRTTGERVTVEADIFADGHDQIAAVLRYRIAEAPTATRDIPADMAWREAPMTAVGNDRWRASFAVDTLGRWEYTVEAWVDRFGSWREDLAKKYAAGMNVTSELLEGAALIRRTAEGLPVGKPETWREAEAWRKAPALRDPAEAEASAYAAEAEASAYAADAEAPARTAEAEASAYAADTHHAPAPREWLLGRALLLEGPDEADLKVAVALADRLADEIRAHASRASATQVRPRPLGRRRAAAGAIWRLVRILPEVCRARRGSKRDLCGGRGAPAGHFGNGLRRGLPAADPPDRPQLPQGTEQRACGRALRSRESVGDRRGGRRPRCRGAGTGHPRGLRTLRRRRPAVRPGGGPRPCAAGVAGSSVGQAAPGMVPPPARRNDQVRGESAQEVPGHLPDRLRVAFGLAPAVAGDRGRRRRLDRARCPDLSRGQPAHQAVPVLGMADRGDSPPPPRRGLPGRGLHAAEADVLPREGRLLAVVHLLHLAKHQAGNHRLLRCARQGKHPEYFRPTSSPTRRTSSPNSCSAAASRRSRLASSSRPRWGRATASTAASSCARTARFRGPRNTSTRRSTRFARETGTVPATSRNSCRV